MLFSSLPKRELSPFFFHLLTLAFVKKLIKLFLAACLIFQFHAQAAHIITSSPFSSTNAFGLSPFLSWRTLETENFRIIFPLNLKEIANRSATYLEEAHSILSPLFRWKPNYKPTVLVIDNSDFANGLTAPILRIGMVLWVTPPDNWDSTGYYDDWLRLLIFHESTHFYNMDATSGIWNIARSLFGDTLLPNSLWNPWMLEGLAVYMETRFTHSGRGKSPYYDMVLRAAVNDGTFDTLSFVTLQQLGGANPYFPMGDTRYQFGYHLIHELSQTQPQMSKNTTHSTGDDLLGTLSKKSSFEFPFYFNENIDHFVGNHWNYYWKQFSEKTKKRAHHDLNKLKSQPITEYSRLNERNHQSSVSILGMAESPDHHWLAYTQTSADQRSGLYLKNLQTQEVQRLDDKLGGIGMKFTSDSKFLIYSEIRILDQYSTFSDLQIYSIEQNSSYALTHRMRAKDPDLSQDGKWVTFTFSENATTGLALAPLIQRDGRFELGPIDKIYIPPIYDHLANPKFSLDGTKIYFSLHPNGKNQEDIFVWNRTSRQATVLVSNGFYNRFPAISTDGELYFVSNLTGVDNLYHDAGAHQDPKLVTNMITGIRFPFFNSENSLYAGVFTSSGWDLGYLTLFKSPISPQLVTISSPPSPASSPQIDHPNPGPQTYSDQPYSPFPTLLPRAWTPLIELGSQGYVFGAECIGFDAVDRHRYMLGVSYESQLHQWDGFALYSNRSLGPTITLSGGSLTQNRYLDSAGVQFSEIQNVSLTTAFPFISTYTTWAPSLGINIQKSLKYQLAPNDSNASLLSASSVVPSLEAQVVYSHLESSLLGLTAESGNYAAIAARYSLDSENAIWKGFFTDQHFFRLGKHTILNGSANFQWASRSHSNFAYSNASLAGRTSNLLGPFLGNNLNFISTRGYPGMLFNGKAAGSLAFNLYFPLMRIFKGWDTHPLFFDNLYGVTFAEISGLSDANPIDFLLPSAGGGLRLSTELFFVPVTFSAEYHYGFRQDLGGGGDLFFQFIVSAFNF